MISILEIQSSIRALREELEKEFNDGHTKFQRRPYQPDPGAATAAEAGLQLP